MLCSKRMLVARSPHGAVGDSAVVSFEIKGSLVVSCEVSGQRADGVETISPPTKERVHASSHRTRALFYLVGERELINNPACESSAW